MTVQNRAPTSDVSFTAGAWTGSEGTRYTLVDDYPDAAGADYLEVSATAEGRMGFPVFSVPAGSTNISIQVRYYDQKTGAPSCIMRARVMVGGNNYDGANHNPANGVWTAREDNWATNPKTTAAWTVDEVNGVGANALQNAGWSTSDASPTIRLSCIDLQVTYTPGSTLLVVQDGGHAHAAEGPILTQHNVLAVADAGHGHAAETPGLTQHNVLAIAEAIHGHAGDSLGLIQHNVLAILDASHGHAADNLTLTYHESGTLLVIQDGGHAHAAEVPGLIQHNLLAIADASHGHAAEPLALTQHNLLGVQDSLHGHNAESPAFVQHNVLEIQDTLHVQTGDSLSLVQHNLLVVQDAEHGHVVDSLELTQGWVGNINMTAGLFPEYYWPAQAVLTGADNVIFTALRNQVVLTVRELALSGLDTVNIVGRKVPDKRNLALPAIVVAYERETPTGRGSNTRDDVQYGIWVAIFAADNQDLTADTGTYVGWREAILKAFISQRIALGIDGADVYTCAVVPENAAPREAWQQNMLGSWMLLRFTVRQTRGS